MVLGEDKHSWGSQLLNNSERDSQHSVRGGALSGQLIRCKEAVGVGGGGLVEWGWGGGDDCTAEGGRKNV